MYPREDVPDANVNYDGTEADRSDRRGTMRFPPTPRTDTVTPVYWRSEIYRPTLAVQHNPAAGTFHLGGQYPSTEPNHNHDYDGENSRFSDPVGIHQPYGPPMELYQHVHYTQATPMVFHGTGVWGHADSSSSHPVGMVGNEGTAHVLEIPPPAGIDDVGIQQPNKRKRTVTPDRRREGKRDRRKKAQHLDIRKQTYVRTVGITPTRK